MSTAAFSARSPDTHPAVISALAASSSTAHFMVRIVPPSVEVCQVNVTIVPKHSTENVSSVESRTCPRYGRC
jgi:hypothetical protein